MITEKRKRIYIGTIIFCVIASLAAFLIKPSVPEVDPSLYVPPPGGEATFPGAGPTPAGTGQTPVPTTGSGGGSNVLVFPRSSEFDLSVFESDNFKLLQEYNPLSVTESEVGRDDPFKPY